MNLIDDVDIGKEFPNVVSAIVEIPHDSQMKYELNAKKGVLQLDRILHTSMHYPGNYGFIPQTYDKDGDPLDVIIICSVPLDPLTLAEVRPIGLMMMKDEKGEDPKVLAVVKKDPEKDEIQDLSDLPKHWLTKIEHFFKQYKSLEQDKWVDIDGFRDKKEAHKLIKACHDEYNQRKKRKQ